MSTFGDVNFKDNEVDLAVEFYAEEQFQLPALDNELGSVVQQISPTPIIYGNNSPPNSESSVSTTQIQRDEEPEKIKKWREIQQMQLAEKDAEEEKKKEELRQVAKRELEKWYRHYSELFVQTKQANRESAKNAEKQSVADVDEIEPGTEWERISKLCEFNPKANRFNRDTSRLRSIILQLKQSPLKKSIS